jgi:Zn-dependent protease with chaperone function
MYIVAIGWIYVTLLMALTESNITAGILTFALYGLLPLSLFLWIFGAPLRFRRLREAEAVDEVVCEDNGGDAGPDQ